MTFSKIKKYENRQKKILKKITNNSQLYTMSWCGFCNKQEMELNELIKKAGMNISLSQIDNFLKKDYKDLPNNIEGFPAFVSTKTGQVYSGYRDISGLIELSKLL